MPRDTFYYYCKIGNKTFFPKYYFFSDYDFVTLYGLIIKGRTVSFEIELDNNFDQQIVSFYISYLENKIEIYPSLSLFTHLPSIQNSYYVSQNYILLNYYSNLIIYLYDNHLEKNLEERYCYELRKRKKEYLIARRKSSKEYKKNSSKNNKLWLICDKKDQAGDNGEYFFRYLNHIKPKGIDFFFIIIKNCSDYKRLKKYKNVIDLNSSKHLNLFLKADKIISSISDSWVTNPFGEDGKYICDLFNFDFIYLQNGIIKDDLSPYFNRIKKNFYLLIASSKKELNSFLNSKYGYNENNVALTGLSRFDNLKKISKKINKERIILLYPTWRLYIKGTINLVTHESIETESFRNTTYFKFYNNLINDEKLLYNMKQSHYKGIFCIHQNFLSQLRYFKKNKIFKFRKKCDTQELLAKSSLLITDYSSIFFDFGYIRKPVLYTHFDYEEYRKNHFHQGYFDYERDGFGPICYNIECSINTIISFINNKCLLKKMYLKKIKKFFYFFDEHNNRRIFNAIVKDNKKSIIKKKLIILNIFIFINMIFFKLYKSNYSK